MSTIASLNINLAVLTDALSKGLKTARGQIDGFVGAIQSPLGQLASVVGVGLSINAFKDFVTGGLEAVDATKNLSISLGTTTRQLQLLQAAAAFADISHEQLTTGLEQLQKKLGEAAAGSKSATEAFDQLGLSVSKLKTKPVTTAFLDTASALAKIVNPAARAKAVIDLFGKSGQKLLPLLSQGAQGIEHLKEKAEAMGLVFSEDQLKSIDDLNDLIKEFSKTVEGLKTEALAGLAPSLKTLFENLRSHGSDVAVITAAVLGFAAALIAVRTALKGVALAQAAVAALQGPKGWATLAIGLAGAAGGMWAVNKMFENAADEAAPRGTVPHGIVTAQPRDANGRLIGQNPLAPTGPSMAKPEAPQELKQIATNTAETKQSIRIIERDLIRLVGPQEELKKAQF